VCVNGKMVFAEIIPGIGGMERKENSRGSEFKYDVSVIL
jgi:hypothetical protein